MRVTPTRSVIRRFPRVAVLASLLLLPPYGLLHAEEDPEEPQVPTVTENVEVRASRLPDLAVPLVEVPGHVSVVERHEIEASPAPTLQDLLAPLPGALVYDQTGNFVQKVFDLRGFNSGTGTAVYLDGVRLNDPRNNTLALELIPLDVVERVEVMRGSDAALAGGGSQAGTIHLRTGSAEGFAGTVSAAGGNLGTTEFRGNIGFEAGRFDVLVAGGTGSTDGFRENGAVDQDQVTVRAGFDAGSGRSLTLTTVFSNADAGTPGSLTPEELAADSESAPYNAADFLDRRGSMVALAFDSPVGRGLSLAFNVYRRDGRSESLTTGRTAAAFGQGFLADLDSTTVGAVGQVTHQRQWARRSNRVVAGVEWLGGDTSALGWFVPVDDPRPPDPSTPGSDNRTERDTWSLYAEDSFKPAPRWTLVLGLRHDRDEVAYSDRIVPSAGRSDRTFSETSPRLGVTWNPWERTGLYVSYAESFLAPTSEQLFAFPGFGSNPDLVPQTSATVEAGWKQTWPDRAHFGLAVFRIDTESEIVFDPSPSPGNLFGRNVNAGETLRVGVEADTRVLLSSKWALHASASWIDATFADDIGGRNGDTIPLVPRGTAYVAVDGSLPGRVGLRLEGRWVGEQYLEGDERNERRRLEAYAVANARVTWLAWSAGDGERGRGGNGVELFAEVRNLLDEEYATRGIWAFDFLAGQPSAFLTPAPPRNWLLGVSWRF